MSTPDHLPQVRCQHCGDVIGVYEPLVLLCASDRRETSLAAEPDLAAGASSAYHRACSIHAGENR